MAKYYKFPRKLIPFDRRKELADWLRRVRGIVDDGQLLSVMAGTAHTGGRWFNDPTLDWRLFQAKRRMVERCRARLRRRAGISTKRKRKTVELFHASSKKNSVKISSAGSGMYLTTNSSSVAWAALTGGSSSSTSSVIQAVQQSGQTALQQLQQQMDQQLQAQLHAAMVGPPQPVMLHTANLPQTLTLYQTLMNVDEDTEEPEDDTEEPVDTDKEEPVDNDIEEG